ncbi:DUF1292 domain-containing protein [Peribacillus glennii]|uniref:DUF1292 domain-containing protein n=1 Tax=Peribacillus glennii TaxID=2303991 RepID=A0A372L8A3_9BACI|nr:DUF1292 domain-containing protein [Peribacillus glennii]RFU61058.1 DUF1292 domain-containing protein [Peribacillus glennii]
MTVPQVRDFIIIEEEDGEERQFAVDALFDVEDESYALLSSGDDLLLMRVEEEDGEQYLVGLDDPIERENILHAYEVAVESAPAE